MENIHTHSFYGMGSHIQLWLQHPNAKVAQEILVEAEDIFVRHEAIMSRFDPNSELSQLNAHPEQWVQVSNILWEVINRAIQFAYQLDGLFDPTILDALEQAGYAQNFVEGASFKQDFKTSPSKSRASYTAVQINPIHKAIRLPRGIRLDLGGIGKGFTAETAVDFLRSWGPCLVDAGGDLTAGNAPSDSPGWPVGIATPYCSLEERPDLLRLWLENGTLATSGIDYRHWEQNGESHHHIIDPYLNASAQTDLATVSVLSEDACVAEAWATAVLVAGFDAGYKMSSQQQMSVAFIHQNQDLVVSPALFPQVQFTDLSSI